MPKPIIIAHRGLRSEFPENTTLAIQAAIELSGVHAVEFDIECSDRAMVLHQETMVPDPEFKRLILATRNYSGREWVKNYTAQKIMQLDAGSWFADKFSNLKVPSLSEILALNWQDKIAHIEVKDPTFWSKRDNTIPKRFRELILPELQTFSGKYEILSFNPEILREFKTVDSSIATTLALWTEWINLAVEAVKLATSVNANNVTIADVMVLQNKELVTRFHDEGIKVYVYPVSPAYDEPEHDNWTANSQFEKWDKLIALEIDGLVTDHAREAVEYIYAAQ